MRGERELRLLIREELMRLDEAPTTVGDVKKALEFAKGKKREELAKAVGRQAAKSVGMAVVKQIPILGNVANALEAGLELKDLYSTLKSVDPTVKQKNPLWDKMTIDPETAAIVDDEVEERFIDSLGQRVQGLPDDTELPDADEQLASWLKGKYSGAHVTKAT